MVRKCITLIFWLSALTMTRGQSAKTNQEILQRSIDLEELQPHLTGIETLYILDNGVVPNTLEVEKFGKPVKFEDISTLFFISVDNYLEFGEFYVRDHRAEVAFSISSHGIVVRLVFEKSGEHWEIIQKEVSK